MDMKLLRIDEARPDKAARTAIIGEHRGVAARKERRGRGTIKFVGAALVVISIWQISLSLLWAVGAMAALLLAAGVWACFHVEDNYTVY